MLTRTQGLAIVSSDKDPASWSLQAHGGWFEEGRMYLQSPFQNHLYVEASEAHEFFAVERQRQFVRLCQALGARSIEVLNVHDVTRDATHDGGAGVKKGAEVEARVTANSKDRFTRTLRTMDVFKGAPPDLDSARRILADANLSSDSEFSCLLDLMGGTNLLREREYELTVTRSGQQQLSLAASVKVPVYAKVSVDYSSKLKVREEYQIRLKILFGEERSRR